MATRIVLIMIIRNESRIIRRCLNSARSVLDAISICDTGSDDKTVELVEEAIKEFGIPGVVHKHQWVDFGHNRTLSFQEGQRYVRDTLGWPLESTYSIFLDADMLLEVREGFDKSQLTGDGISIEQYNSTLSYFNLRLARMSLPWSSISVTHEYWGFKKGALPEGFKKKDQQLKTLQIDDRDDGGCKSDKYERDIRLLTQGIADEPDNERYMFYLGQSYKCIKDYEKSIEWYEKRIKAGGWYEEVWYSHYMIADCYKGLKNWPKALEWYLKAYQNHPGRAEPLYEIAKYYRELPDQQELGFLFAQMAMSIPYPKKDVLFINHTIYDYECLREMAICGGYTRSHKDEGMDACEELIFDREIPEHVQKHAVECEFFYVPKLSVDGSKSITIPLPDIVVKTGDQGPKSGEKEEEKKEPKTGEEEKKKWIGLNPSIINDQNGYTMIYRSVNYEHDPARGTYDSMEGDGVIRTRNYLVKLDREFNVISSHEIINNIQTDKYPSSVEGMEDCRLFIHQSRYWFTCTSCETRVRRIPRICLARLSRRPNQDGYYEVDFFKPLNGLKDEGSCEKNWLPFEDEGEIRVIYDYEPFVVAKVDRNSGSITPVQKCKMPYNLSRFRGSAGPIDFDRGYLFVIHEVTFRHVGGYTRRYYFHRFVWMDRKYQLQKFSKPFYFEEKTTEFCSGICSFVEGGKLILTCGLKDKEAKAYWVKMDLVRKMLRTVRVEDQ
jgi:tetratricopeptide (TPR) repeat protein